MNSKRLFRILLGLMLIFLLAFGYGVKTGLSKLGSEKEDIATLLAKLEAADEKLSLVIKTQSQLDQLGFIETIAKEVLPDEKAQPELLGQILLIAQKSNVTIRSVTFSGQTATGSSELPEITQAEPLVDIPGVYTVPLTIQISGDYDDMLDMLRSLEQNRRKIQTRSVSIKPVIGDDGNPTSAVTADITIDVYVRPDA